MKFLHKVLFLLTLIPISNIKTAEKNFRPLYKKVKLSESEKFIKELYQENAPIVTFLRMHEVTPSLANKLNLLLTPEVQKAFIELNFKLLTKKGFVFFIKEKLFIFSHKHKDFQDYVFKFPVLWPGASGCSLKNIDRDTVDDIILNASRVWLAQWINIIQNEFKAPNKQIYFVKSNFPVLSILVVAQRIKEFYKEPYIKNLKDFTPSQANALEKLFKIGAFDQHADNFRGKYFIDSEARINTDQFLEDPFIVYNDPLMKKQIKSNL